MISKKRNRLRVLMIVIVLLIFGASFIWYGVRQFFIARVFSHLQQPVVTISTMLAQQQKWSVTFQAVGNLVAKQGVLVNSQVAGQILGLYFKSGQTVKKGDVLVQLDDALDQQTLKQALAKWHLAQISYKRQSNLYNQRFIAQSAVDQAKSMMLQAKATVEAARLTIAKKSIKAPFSGKLGIRQVNVGQYINPGQGIVSLQSLDPLYVDFHLPEQYFSRVHPHQVIHFQVDAYPNRQFKGVVSAVDAGIMVNTRSIAVRATVPNPSHSLYPGLFAKVTLILPEKKTVVVVPQTAISYSLYGNVVYVVAHKKNKQGKTILFVKEQFVTLGEQRGSLIVIKKGIKAGTQIVATGQFKLHNNTPVHINNSIKLKA